MEKDIFYNPRADPQHWRNLAKTANKTRLRLNKIHKNQIFINMQVDISFVYQKALIRTFHTSFLTTQQLFVNSQHYSTNSKGYFVLKTRF